MKTIDAQVFEAQNKTAKLIRTIGGKPWQIELYYNIDDGFHYAKGPFGRWDAVCYVKLPFKEQEDIDDWIRKMIEANQ